MWTSGEQCRHRAGPDDRQHQRREEFDAVIAVHLKGHFATMRHAASRGGGDCPKRAKRKDLLTRGIINFPTLARAWGQRGAEQLLAPPEWTAA